MADRLTQERLDEIRARCDAARPGPWHDCRILGRGAWRLIYSQSRGNEITHVAPRPYRWVEPNAAFIAASRTDVPALLDEIDALKTDLKVACDIAADRSWWKR